MRVRLALVPLVAAAALLGGCATKTDIATLATATPTGNGVDALAADEILTRTKAALSAAKSFRTKGEVTKDGETARIDFTFSGKDLAGTVEKGGIKIEAIKLGDDLFLKAPDAFWTSFIPQGKASALALIKGKYVKVDATNAAFASLVNSYTPEEIIKPEGTTTKRGIKTFNAVPAIGLIDSKAMSIYVATQGEPVPLAVETAAGKSTLTFTEYNQPVEIKAPSAAEVFDLKGLLGG